MYANWALDYLSLYCLHINYKEKFTTVLAAHRWAPFWSGHRVIIKTDSQVAAAILNKDSTCFPVIMDWIRSLFWHKEYCNFSLLVKHIPGATNTLPGSNDFESYMSPLSLALPRSKGLAATWPWSHQFPAPSICTYYQVHLRDSNAFIPILLCILRLPASPKSSINPYSLCSFYGKVTLSNLHPSLFKCGSHSTPWTWSDWPSQKQFSVGNYTSRKQACKTFNSVPKETDYTPFPISLQESLKFGQTFACNFLHGQFV